MVLIRNQISLSIILIKVSKAIFLIFVRFELFFSYVRNIVKSIVNTNRDDRRVRVRVIFQRSLFVHIFLRVVMIILKEDRGLIPVIPVPLTIF